MKLIIKTPKQSLNKAFLKQRPLRSEIDLFKDNLTKLLGKIDEIEREENQKTHIRDFLRDTYYKESNEINTKDSKDLVIHIGKTNKDNVGVIIEAKRPSNKNEMLTADKPNTKAFQELVLYYLRERIEEKNNDIQYLVATNIYEWYIFEASYFEKAFFKNKAFVKQYEDWRDGKKVTKDTSLFYNEIAKPFINTLEDEISCTHFDIRTYETALKNADKEDDKKLIQLLKILSPNHLLKVSFADDSNTLDEKFYKELLHIIGLEEAKDGSKFIIRRKLEDKRNAGSLLEMAISILETEDPLHKVTDIQNYGESKDEKTYNVALELCITWINRILFLKLLEGQLVNYHKGDKAYRFLNSDMIKDFDELYKLFHQVLAKTTEERSKIVKEKFSRVPYLNSSLFEISDLEDQTLKINQLDNSAQLELINSSILKKSPLPLERGFRGEVSLPSLQYIFRFLDAYDFASEGKEDIQEDSKKLINASVLGKVFEKINGYKDGSIFTPGFITMYMCRQSIRLAVLQKFTDKYAWKADTFDDLKNYLADKKSSKETLINNQLINSLHICDPAVGSGHFLVSSLNEIIAIKSELGLLADDKGVRITDYEVTIENDELIVSDEEGEIFEYISPLHRRGVRGEAMQRLQRTLFHEKQTIIENCLFGVDINPNSVKICRLRLWIELLKNAYYKAPSPSQRAGGEAELETLPNIDINIKCGNSLLSRFPLDIDLTEAFKKQQFNLDTYKTAVEAYRKTSDKKAKGELTALIKKIKEEYTATIYKRDPRRKKLADIRGQIVLVQNNIDLFGTKKLSDKDKVIEERRLTLLLEQKEKELQEAEKGVMYRSAFEWRFEFPEVLDSLGNFIGFELMIGNPPYISLQDMIGSNKPLTKYYQEHFKTASGGNFDIYIPFIEKAMTLISRSGYVDFIMPNVWIFSEYGKTLRNHVLKNELLERFLDFGSTQVFADATIYTACQLFSFRPKKELLFQRINAKEFEPNVQYSKLKYSDLGEGSWSLSEEIVFKLKKKIERFGEPLGDISHIFVGIQTSADHIYHLEKKGDGQYYSKSLGKEIELEDGIMQPIVTGTDVKRYKHLESIKYLLHPYQRTAPYQLFSEEIMKKSFPKTWNYLKQNEDELRRREKNKMDKGNWYAYIYPKNLDKQDLVKICVAQTVNALQCAIDENGQFFLNNVRVNGISPINSESLNIKYLLGLLNSKVANFYFKQIAKPKDNGYYEANKQFIYSIPINTSAESKYKLKIISLVDEILSKRENKDVTLDAESKIDDIVYKLYNLTPAEIKIVEGK